MPKLAVASEITGGMGAGAGRYVGEEVYPEKAWVRPLAEMAGGIAGGLVPTAAIHTPSALTYRAGKKLIEKGALPFGEKGSRFRAGEFLKKQVKTPEEAAKAATGETIGDLPPVVASGEKRLMALYKQFREADAITDAESVEKIGKIYIQRKGITLKKAEEIIDLTCTRSLIPEPIRAAHLIAGGIATGESAERDRSASWSSFFDTSPQVLPGPFESASSCWRRKMNRLCKSAKSLRSRVAMSTATAR